MDITNILLTVGCLATLCFEADGKVSCFACSSSDRACRRDEMNEVQAGKGTDCDHCVVLYATEPPNYVLRSCRRHPSGYDSKDECKDTSFEGEKRCFCHSDWCNGKEMDSFVKQGAQGNTGTGTGTTRPTSSGMPLGMRGQVIAGLLLLLMISMQVSCRLA